MFGLFRNVILSTSSLHSILPNIALKWEIENKLSMNLLRCRGWCEYIFQSFPGISEGNEKYRNTGIIQVKPWHLNVIKAIMYFLYFLCLYPNPIKGGGGSRSSIKDINLNLLQFYFFRCFISISPYVLPKILLLMKDLNLFSIYPVVLAWMNTINP